MADVPGLIEDALETLRVALDAIADWTCVRDVTPEDPEAIAPPDDWPDGERVLVLITPTGGDEVAETREKGVPHREQVGRYTAIVWAKAPTSPATAWETVRRTALNTIEQQSGDPDWEMDWRAWRRQDTPAPFVGVAIDFEIWLNE